MKTNNVKRVALTLLLAVLTTTAWALEQDPANGYYLIGSAQDWQDFVAIINGGTTNANARMIADVDVIGNSMVGNSTSPYAGIFDGQGHTLTINYDRTGLAYSQSMDYGAAPFLFIRNAAIKNLHVDGSIHTSTKFAAGVVGDVQGTQSLIEKCRSSVNITSSVNGEGCMGGVVSHMTNGHTVFIRDCLFDGSFDAPNAWGNGGIMGYKNGTATIENCFFAPSALSSGSSYSYCIMREGGGGTTTINNCYYTQQLGTAQGTQANAEQLASGEITYKLQSNRGDLVWGQTIATQNLPKLHLFDNTALRVYRTIDGYSNNPEEALLSQDSDGYFLIGTSDDWRALAMLVDEMEQGVNAKMTADIDLGDAQVMVGDGYYPNAQYRRPFMGVFDGQGHTLTIHYVTESIAAGYVNAGLSVPDYIGCAPFGYVWNGTIRNLHTAGTITSTHWSVAGIVGWTNGTVLIENCHSSVDITITNGTYGMSGISHNCYNDNHNLTIQDCIYDGTLTAGSYKAGSAGFVSYRSYGNVYIKNSLLAATFANGLGSGDCATFVRNNFGSGYISNSHFKTALGTIQGNQATADELASGRTAFYLQNGRDELVWGQEIGVDPLPVLTSDESKRVYRSATGYTNDPSLAVADQGIYPFNYTEDSNGNLTITGFETGFTPPDDFALVIPDQIDGKNIVAIGTNAFKSATRIASVTLGEYVTTIKSNAFWGCTGMTSIDLKNVQVIEEHGVEYTGLTSLTLPSSVTTIGYRAFNQNYNLASLDMSHVTQLTKLETEVFRMAAFSSVTIPACVTIIGSSAFASNTALSSIVIPNTVTKIENSAFSGCTSLASASLPTGITDANLGTDIFNGCTALGSVNLNELTSLTNIPSNMCLTLKKVDTIVNKNGENQKETEEIQSRRKNGDGEASLSRRHKSK